MRERSQYTTQRRLAVRHLEEDFVPDGCLSKPAWKEALKASLVDNSNPSRQAVVSTEVAALWSESSLYCAFWCEYEHLNVYSGEDPALERWELWDRDVVEVFVNPFPDRLGTYWEFEVAPNNQWIDLAVHWDKELRADASWDSRFQHATRVNRDQQTWTCEMRIPAAAFGLRRIEAGNSWRINFYRCDGFGDDSQRQFYAWSPTLNQTFHVPNRFGIIEFEK
ncbi:MAG: carbohydrate-binding family 9-like protein [Acidobacteriota bacterium]